MMKNMTVRDILNRLEAWIPAATAQSYDNVGLQVGDPNAAVARGLVALDLTPSVVDEAVESGVDLIVTHHPLLFKGSKRIDASDFIGGMIHKLIANGISLVAAHTNLDAASDGVSAKLAEVLGLQSTRFLQPLPSDTVKLVTFVPADHADAVRRAIGAASSYRQGEYTDMAFQMAGEGFFRALEGANPFIGSTGGDVERVDERRVEATVLKQDLSAVVTAMRDAHPYEEVAYDVYPMELPSGQFGMGMIGELTEPESLSKFLDRVCDRLEVPAARFVGDPESEVRRVAVCGGAGRDLVGAAMASGADVYVTADLSYHIFFDVLDGSGHPRMALVDAGHYETEAATEELLVDWLSDHCGDAEWVRTGVRTSPIRYHAP